MLRPVGKFSQLYRRADEILGRVGMIEKRKETVKNLSHGEQRQVEIGMALLGEPRLLLLTSPRLVLPPPNRR